MLTDVPRRRFDPVVPAAVLLVCVAVFWLLGATRTDHRDIPGGIPGSRGGDRLVAWAATYPIEEPYTGQMSASVEFHGMVQGGTPPYAYSWVFGDGGTSQAIDGTHTYQVAGSYIAVLTVIDSAGVAATGTVTPTPRFPVYPQTRISANPTLGPAPLTVRFEVFENTGGAWLYAWEFGDGSNSAQRNPTHTFARPDTYKVHLSVTTPEAGPEPYEMTVIATGDEPPKVLAIYGSEVSGTCRPFTQNVSFSSIAGAGTGPYGYRWDFGDGNASSLPDPTHAYAWHSEPLAVNLTLTDANGTVATTSLSYQISPPPGCFPPVGANSYREAWVVVGGAIALVTTALVIRRSKRSRV
jgi:PKD repeat protein